MLRNLHLALSYIRRQLRYKALQRRGISIDPSAIVDHSTTFAEYCTIYREVYLSGCSIGRLSYVGPRTIITNADLGSFCSIGSGIRIGPGFHPTSWLSTHPAFYSNSMQSGRAFVKSRLFNDQRRVTVGHDVWVGANAIILDGVTVGHGAIIAAGAVVNSNVSPYSIVGGVPAKPIRMRFDQEKIDDLLRWQWWNLPLDKLEKLGPHFKDDGDWNVDEMKRHVNQL